MVGGFGRVCPRVCEIPHNSECRRSSHGQIHITMAEAAPTSFKHEGRVVAESPEFSHGGEQDSHATKAIIGRGSGAKASAPSPSSNERERGPGALQRQRTHHRLKPRRRGVSRPTRKSSSTRGEEYKLRCVRSRANRSEPQRTTLIWPSHTRHGDSSRVSNNGPEIQRRISPHNISEQKGPCESSVRGMCFQGGPPPCVDVRPSVRMDTTCAGELAGTELDNRRWRLT